MTASVKFTTSTFTVKNKRAFRAEPEKEFEHRLKTRAHLTYLRDEKLFNLSDPRWAKKTIDGEVCYGHEYEGSLLVVRLKTADGRLDLSHNEDGALDRHLMDNPGQEVVYSITSSNNGLESNHFFKAESIGLSSLAIVCAALVLTVNLGSGVAAAEAAAEAGEAVATLFGVEATVFPAVGIVIAVLAFIGIWIAYEVGREIMLNLIYENRSSNKSVTLVDSALYNIDSSFPSTLTLEPIHGDGDFEFYDDVVINIDNYSKFKGIGVSLKFQKEDGSALVICIRQDIYKDPHYTIAALAKGDRTSAQEVYDNCTSGGLVSEDFRWGDDLIVKNRLDPQGFNQYTFAGILSFHDAV